MIFFNFINSYAYQQMIIANRGISLYMHQNVFARASLSNHFEMLI